MYPAKLKPAFKNYLWGGVRLRDEFQLDCGACDPVAEAWVLSCHPDGPSVVANGEQKGKTLQEALEVWGAAALGTRGAAFKAFPVLIKLIDAKQNLSVQVHPDNEYALAHEGEYGKTEMWYVVDCAPGAFLYHGFQRKLSRAELKERMQSGTLLDVLHKAEVKKGDCFLIEAGTVHAIGAGLLIAEVQQNSNTTYRMYDYGRVGADGKRRILHIDKAADVAVPAPAKRVECSGFGRLAQCKYFTVDRMAVSGETGVEAGADSFVCLLAVEGSGEIRWNEKSYSFRRGECYFLPAGLGEVSVAGACTLLKTTVSYQPDSKAP